jgi:signal transduction histidine kinase
MKENSATILVVDDTETNIDILIELLSDYNVAVALNGERAIKIANKKKIDLILLDIMMPIMDGYETCRRLKLDDKTKDIPIIFITAKVDEKSIENGYDVGGIDYITKPFKPKELIARVKTQLKLKSLIDNLEDKVKQEVSRRLHEQNEKDEFLFQYSKKAALGEIISMIAHQWKQPLGAINGAITSVEIKLEMEKFDFTRYEDVLEFLKLIENKHQNIKDYIQSMLETMNDFRNFFRPSKTKELLPLTTPINRALHIIQTSISSKGIKINLDFQNNKDVMIYPNNIMQVVLNILKNAEDNFIEKKIDDATITISTKSDNDSDIITIFDNGGGIPEDIMDKIFEPYFTTKNEEKGTGIGLYMSKLIIEENLTGTIKAINKNGGVAFEIKLNKTE